MDKGAWCRSMAAVALAVGSAWPVAAGAVELAELSWSGRFGSGSIVYDRDVADARDAAGRGSFMDSIRSFDFYGLKLPWGSGGITARGTSGSVLTLDKTYPCGHFNTCEASSVSFLLGRAVANDPLSYKLTFSLPFKLDADDQIPLYEDGHVDQYEDRWITAWVSNEFNSPSGDVFTIGSPSQVIHRLLPGLASPVPEPGTWALFAMGAGLIGFARRRKA